MTDPDRRPGVAIRRDLVHTQVVGYRPLALDLYVPTAPRALCVYAHGGGWLRGSRRNGPGPLSPNSSRWLERAAAHGLAIASIDYRLSGEAHWPAQRDDVDAAVAWLHFRRDEFGLGTGPLVTWGVSAGGQLAAIRALGGTTPAARACALWYAPTDLRRVPIVPVDGGPSREERLLGGPVASRPELAAAASPIDLVHRAAPPFLLVHGTADEAVPFEQSERFAAALTAAGADARLLPVDGFGHVLTGIPDDELGALVDATAHFLLAATAPQTRPSGGEAELHLQRPISRPRGS